MGDKETRRWLPGADILGVSKKADYDYDYDYDYGHDHEREREKRRPSMAQCNNRLAL